MIIYIDMVADLCHYGHFNAIKQIYDKFIKSTNNKLYVGIHNDATVESYKRRPILTMEERIKTISYINYIDKIIPNAPITITQEYIDLYSIDIVCIPDTRTKEEINLMCYVPESLGMIHIIKYTQDISTSDIIKRIKEREDLNCL